MCRCNVFEITGTGCEKQRGEALVLAKEHIDAALPTAKTPNAKSAGTRMSSFVPWRMMRSRLMAT